MGDGSGLENRRAMSLGGPTLASPLRHQSVAQSGSAPALDAGGRWFKSNRSDHRPTVRRLMNIEGRRRVVDIAAVDWRGGYRTPPTLDAARGCVRGAVPPGDVDRAASLYRGCFEEWLTHPRRSP